MKNYFLAILIVFVIISCLFSFKFVRASMPLSGKVIVVDAGHGGKDVGTSYNKIYEKDINLAISLKLERVLTKYGAIVILTRTGDYDLSSPNVSLRKKSDFDNRIKLINNNNVDLYLSIHQNYLNDFDYYGPQVFYNNDNYDLAKIIQEFLNRISDAKRETKKIPSSTYMYSKLKVKGVLIECGFISNAQERLKLTTDEYQEIVANAIGDGVINYFS